MGEWDVCMARKGEHDWGRRVTWWYSCQWRRWLGRVDGEVMLLHGQWDGEWGGDLLFAGCSSNTHTQSGYGTCGDPQGTALISISKYMRNIVEDFIQPYEKLLEIIFFHKRRTSDQTI